MVKDGGKGNRGRGVNGTSADGRIIICASTLILLSTGALTIHVNGFGASQ